VSRTEVILYAMPTGALGRACDELYAAATRLGPTTAQAFPPHCTLTGFFRRPPGEVPRLVDELTRATGAVSGVAAADVDVSPLRCCREWVGYELRSEALTDLARRFVAVHRADEGDDAVRLKDGLHLSLAYGGVADLAPYAEVAAGLPPPEPCAWEVALWERGPDGTWLRHGARP
jgi:hypothetical protein